MKRVQQSLIDDGIDLYGSEVVRLMRRHPAKRAKRPVRMGNRATDWAAVFDPLRPPARVIDPLLV